MIENGVQFDKLMEIYVQGLQTEVLQSNHAVPCRMLVSGVVDVLEVELPAVDYAEQLLVLVFYSR